MDGIVRPFQVRNRLVFETIYVVVTFTRYLYFYSPRTKIKSY